MEFSNWYVKSIQEAQERYKKEDKAKQAEVNKNKEHTYHDENYGSVATSIDEDLLRYDDDGGADGGWVGL